MLRIMARDVARGYGLTDMQARFVALLASGREPGAAYLEAGYSAQPKDACGLGTTLTRHPAILAALHIEVGRQLQVDALVARRVIGELIRDENVSAKVRADLGVKLLRLAGHVEPRAAIADHGPVKTLSEMSTEELRARAAQLEDEIASRARPIRATDEPSEPQAIDIIE